MTHWRGIPLKNLSRDECLDAMQDLHRRYHSILDQYGALIQKAGNVDRFISS